MKRLGVAIALAALTTGCGGSNSAPEGGAEPASPTTTLEAPSEDAEPTAVPPNVGDRALRVGEPRRGLAATMTVKEIKFPYPPGAYNTPEPGNDYLGLRLEQCASPRYDPATYGGDFISTNNNEWYAISPSGEQVTGGLSDIAWPRPKFPESVTAQPGDCLKGWITVEVPKGFRIERVLWRSDQASVAEWLP